MNKGQYLLYRMFAKLYSAWNSLTFTIKFAYFRLKYGGAKNIPSEAVGSLLDLDGEAKGWENGLIAALSIQSIAAAIGKPVEELVIFAIWTYGRNNELDTPEEFELYEKIFEVKDVHRYMFNLAVDLGDIPKNYVEYHWYEDFSKWMNSPRNSVASVYKPYNWQRKEENEGS